MQVDLRGKVARVTGSAHWVGESIEHEVVRTGVHDVVNNNNTSESVVGQTVSQI